MVDLLETVRRVFGTLAFPVALAGVFLLAPTGTSGGFALTDPLVPVKCGSGIDPATNRPYEPCGVNDLRGVFDNVQRWLVLVGGAAAVLAVVVAGARYIVAVFEGADPSAIAGAKQSLGYAIFGIILLLIVVVVIRSIYQALTGRPDTGLPNL